MVGFQSIANWSGPALDGRRRFALSSVKGLAANTCTLAAAMSRTLKLLNRKLLAAACLAAVAIAGCAHRPPARAEILAAVGDYLGAPYQLAGEDSSGIDCSGLVRAAYARAGLKLPRNVAEQVKACPQVTRELLQPGDIVFFGARPNGDRDDCRANHCGIYLGQGQFAHASRNRGVVVSDLSGGHWGPRFLFGCSCLAD